MKDKKPEEMTTPPVSMQDHFDIFKYAEGEVKSMLSSLETGWLSAGLRLFYSEPSLDPSDVPGQGYVIECGATEILDHVEQRLVESEEEWWQIVEEGQDQNPLPYEFVKHLYGDVKAKLEYSAGGRELQVFVGGVLAGNSTSTWGDGCDYCERRGGKFRLTYSYDPGTDTYVPWCRIIEC